MQVLYTVLLVIGIIVAVLFALLVFVTGKGDAMSGGSSVRTTFKGKASFDDIMSRMTLILGISFMLLMLVLDVVSNIAERPVAPRAEPADQTQEQATPVEPEATTQPEAEPSPATPETTEGE